MASNAEIAAKGYELFSKGEHAEVLALFASDVKIDTVWAGNFVGAEGYFGHLAKSYTPANLQVKTLIASGEHVAVLFDIELTGNISGKTHTYTSANFLTMKDGKITSMVDVSDTKALAENA